MTAANALPPGQDKGLYLTESTASDFQMVRAPEQVLVEAQQAAAALQKRIAGKAKPVKFNGEQYIENDDWQMLANFWGYSPKVESCDFVEYADVQGFKASAVLLNERTGAIVGRGEAWCLDEEENWGERAKYEWRDVLDANGKKIWENGKCRRERVQVGVGPVPLFQLASMAQTRACSKVMRNKLAWVVTLAGYQTTPAEELPSRDEDDDSHVTQVTSEDLPTEIRRKPASSAADTRPQPSQVREAAAVRGGAAPTGSASPRSFDRTPAPAREAVITEPQARRFFAIWREAGKSKPEVEDYLMKEFGITSDRDIPVASYKEACAWAEREPQGRW